METSKKSFIRLASTSHTCQKIKDFKGFLGKKVNSWVVNFKVSWSVFNEGDLKK